MRQPLYLLYLPCRLLYPNVVSTFKSVCSEFGFWALILMFTEDIIYRPYSLFSTRIYAALYHGKDHVISGIFISKVTSRENCWLQYKQPAHYETASAIYTDLFKRLENVIYISHTFFKLTSSRENLTITL